MRSLFRVLQSICWGYRKLILSSCMIQRVYYFTRSDLRQLDSESIRVDIMIMEAEPNNHLLACFLHSLHAHIILMVITQR